MQEWSLQTTGWHLKGSDQTFNLSSLNPEQYDDALFYKDRWMNEIDFRIMKTEFEARPVFLQRNDRIAAHFLTCFLSLLLYKYLEKKINRGINHFTPEEMRKIISYTKNKRQ